MTYAKPAKPYTLTGRIECAGGGNDRSLLRMRERARDEVSDCSLIPGGQTARDHI